jgi:hypothetical protein
MQDRKRWKRALGWGILLSAVPVFGFMLMTITPFTSKFSHLASSLLILALPGILFAAFVLRQPHGPSPLGILCLTLPFNVVLYGAICYTLIKRR